MSWLFLSWLLVFFIQIGLFGRSMYALICLEDLSQDFINPYDLSTKLNKYVVRYDLTLTVQSWRCDNGLVM